MQESFDGIAYVNLEGLIISANEDFGILTGYGRLISQDIPISEIVEDSDKMIETAANGRTFWRKEFPIIRRDGERIHAMLNVSGIGSQESETIGFIFRISTVLDSKR